MVADRLFVIQNAIRIVTQRDMHNSSQATALGLPRKIGSHLLQGGADSSGDFKMPIENRSDGPPNGMSRFGALPVLRNPPPKTPFTRRVLRHSQAVTIPEITAILI